jgi:hypothetical protein
MKGTMMTQDRGIVRQLDWESLFPWLLLFRTFRVASSIPVLLLATVGGIATPLGWRVAEVLFVGQDTLDADLDFHHVVQWNRRWPGERSVVPAPHGGRFPQSVREVVTTATNTVEPVFHQFVDPVRRLFRSPLPVTQAAYYVFGLLWLLVVWGFFGGAINRMAIVWLGREERIGAGEAMRHAARKLGAYVASPLFPLFGVLLTAIPMALVGLLMRMDWGVLLIGVAWLLVLIGGLIIVLFLMGLLFGWPLMWGAISAEEDGDAFEAFSRSYSYTFQRPLHYLFYALVATIFGAFCWLLVYQFSEKVIEFSHWATALGSGAERSQLVSDMQTGIAIGEVADSTALNVGAASINFWDGLVRALATGFGYGFFWSLAAAVYLLLRKSVDDTAFEAVFVENLQSAYALPDLEKSPPPAATTTPASSTSPSVSSPSSHPALSSGNESAADAADSG